MLSTNILYLLGHKVGSRGWFERDPSVYPELPGRAPSIVCMNLSRILLLVDDIISYFQASKTMLDFDARSLMLSQASATHI